MGDIGRDIKTAERSASTAPATEQTVAKREDQSPEIIDHPNVISIVRRGEVERREHKVTLPAHMQYAVGASLQPTSEGYDFLNRYMGVQFVRPDWVVDENGQKVRNPIHRPDYVYLTLFGIWYNDLGQLVSYREDVEMDFQLLYRTKIVNARSYAIAFKKDEAGGIVSDDQGFPVTTFTVAPDDVLKAQRELFRLRQFGIRAAHTVAKVRIMKTALGIKGLPWRAGDPASSKEDVWRDGSKHGWLPVAHPVIVPVVGFRDALTPDQRWEQTQAAAEAMYGKPRPESKVAADELADDRPEEQDIEHLAFDPDEVAAQFGEEPPPQVDAAVAAQAAAEAASPKKQPKVNW